jgi:flagellin-like protein
MNKRKGITPVIAIIILLLIAVAIAGAAYTYILGYWGGLTSGAIEITDLACETGGVRMFVHNIGTDPLNIMYGKGVNYQRSTFGTPANVTFDESSLRYYNATHSNIVGGGIEGFWLFPGSSGSIVDVNCNSGNSGVTCKYFLEAGGRVTTVQVTC